ncbi:HNH endonuclease [Paenibacillus sp. HN-1]|uniref:HNH endonuclease n=1 Tax=Paenibacillus TaxID=44249 RepID=UPI001CA8002E|nr:MULTISPECIES: HNH endonuclease [Paenibacillus]MBY9077266.1 HNH endonuclease [Paenibacillus sp. CGMCC 1.18879]MBY9083313.1 HNH endonuclease [Paenibacillus sinensis]
MPLKKFCRKAGCSNLTDGEPYCTDHQGERWGYDRDRGTATERGYGRKWQVARARFLRLHPICTECERKGKVTASNVVDHIVPHKGDPVLFWDENNWQALCTPCHSRKTVQQDGGFGNPVRG